MSRLSASIAALLTLGLSARAWAAPLQPLAGPALEGDGQTPHTVLVACPSCTAADKLRVKGDGLTLTGSSVDEDGLLHLDLVAEPVAAPTQRRVSLRVQQASGKLETDLNLQVLPARAAAIGLRFDADAVEAGGPPVKLSWPAPPGPLDPAAARYAISATVGSLGPVTVAADGSGSATWTPPATALAPERVIFGVVDLRAPDQRMGLGSLPLRARTSLSLKVEPDSENVLVVDGERFGPVRASPSGTVAFEVALPPSLGKGSLETTTKTGERRSQAVDLPLGKGALHLILPLPPAVPADPNRPLSVWVARVDRAGAPLSGAAPTLSSSRGELGPVEEGALPGLYRSLWKAPAQVGTVEFLAEADGRRSEAQARLIEGLPSLRLEVDPERLAAKATSLSVRATVTPPEGGLSKEAPPRLDLAGAKLLARPKQVAGAWASSFRVPNAGEVAVQAIAEQPSSGLPPARLLAWASPADPEGRVPITVVAVDALGLPVPGLSLDLAVPKGAGGLPPTGKTGASGELFIAYDPQGDYTPAELTFSGGGLSLSLGLLPGGPSTQAAGTEAHRELLARWQALLPRQVVPREGAAVVAVASASTPVADGPTAGPESAPPAASPAAPAPAAPTAAAPGPAEPTAAAPTSRPRPDRAAKAGWARLGIDASGVAFVLDQQAEDGLAGPEDSAIEAGNLFGGSAPQGVDLGLSALLFPKDGRVGVDLSGGLLRVPLPLEDGDGQLSSLSFSAGLRVRTPLGDKLSWHIVAAAAREPAVLLLYGEAGAVEAVTYPFLGLRAGAGLSLDTDRWYAELQVSEILAFAPVDTRFDLLGELYLAPRWGLRLQAGLDLRSMAFEVGDHNVAIKDQLQRIGLGVTARLP